MRNLKLVIPDAAMSTQHCNILLTREAHNGRRNTTHLKCNGCYDIPICLPLCRTTILTESVFLSHMISRSLWRLVQQLQYTTMLVVFPEYHINCVQPFKCKNINQATGVHPTMPFFFTNCFYLISHPQNRTGLEAKYIVFIRNSFIPILQTATTTDVKTGDEDWDHVGVWSLLFLENCAPGTPGTNYLHSYGN